MKRRLAFGLYALALTLAAPMLAVASVSCVEKDKPPACEPKVLEDFEAAYIVESVAACKGKTRLTCPEMTAIEAKYSAKREAWIRCH